MTEIKIIALRNNNFVIPTLYLLLSHILNLKNHFFKVVICTIIANIAVAKQLETMTHKIDALVLFLNL